MRTPTTEASKKRYVYKRDKARHHQLMARESDPYRGQSTTTVEEDEKPVSRPKYDPDKSGLSKMGGVATRRVGDQYAAVFKQQHRDRQAKLAEIAIETVTDAEMDEWLIANGFKK